MKIAKFTKLKFDPEAERRARAPAIDQWRAEYPNLSTAHDALISFARGGPIDPADVERIVRGYPQRRGKGRGANRDALARSPTGGGKFVDGGEGDWSDHQSATLFDGDSATDHTKGLDDPMHDPEGKDRMQSLRDRSGEDGRAQDGDFIGAVDDDEDDEDQIYFDDFDEDQEIAEDVKLIREYAKFGGAATPGDQSGYPVLDAMRALRLSLVRDNYLRLHCRLHGTNPSEPLSEEELPPMFRRPPRTRIE